MIQRFDPEKQAEILHAIGPVVDAHHHFWDLENNHYPWLQEAPVAAHFGDYSAIQKSFLPADFTVAITGVDVIASVHVEAHWRGGVDPAGETAWLSELGVLPTAIVGHADLLSPTLEQDLMAHQAHSKFCGVRMMTRRAAAPSGAELMQDARFRTGMRLCAAHGLSFDLQATPDLMPAAADLADAVPDMQFILTHAGLPLDRSDAGIDAWKQGITALAARDNMVCKLSGLPMTDWNWTAQSLAPFVDHLMETFGPERLCFGSNFPVDSLFSSYADLVAAYGTCVGLENPSALNAVFRTTAQRIYNLSKSEGAV